MFALLSARTALMDGFQSGLERASLGHFWRAQNLT